MHLVPQSVVDSLLPLTRLASTIVLASETQSSISMANPMSMVRHNVFHGLGEDPSVHINRFNTIAQGNN